MQRPKEHVRAGFLEAAVALFAEAGYEATTMGAVAERAGSSIGNLYKYFPSKEELFAAAVPEDFAREVKRLTREQIAALGAVKDIAQAGERYHALQEELLTLAIAHRERMIVLLRRAEGTPHAGFAAHFTAKLVEWALDYARGAYRIDPSPALRFALTQIYAAYLRSLADALAAFKDPARIREAVFLLSTHHLGGLKRLFEVQS